MISCRLEREKGIMPVPHKVGKNMQGTMNSDCRSRCEMISGMLALWEEGIGTRSRDARQAPAEAALQSALNGWIECNRTCN